MVPIPKKCKNLTVQNDDQSEITDDVYAYRYNKSASISIKEVLFMIATPDRISIKTFFVRLMIQLHLSSNIEYIYKNSTQPGRL